MNKVINKQRNYYRNGDIVYNDKRINSKSANLVYQSVSNQNFTLDSSTGNLYYIYQNDDIAERQGKYEITISFDPWIYARIYPEEINIIGDVPNIIYNASMFVLDQSTGNLIINT